MIDYDCFGYCALCHKNLLKTAIIDGKEEQYFSGEKTDLEVKLNDGSKMRVTTCEKCKSRYDSTKDSKRLMKSVIKGWEKECEKLVADPLKPNWDNKRKDSYMKEYSKKEII